MKRTPFLLLGLLLISTGLQAAPYKGRVFADSNRNGVYDKGETLLPGILVSDGLNVVKTTKDGTFSLPGHEKEKFIFITTPSGYKTHNQHYRRIDSTTDSYEFGLMPSTGIGKDGSHKYVQITDTEIHNTKDHEDWISNLREYAANENAAFIMHTGDICYENGLKEHIKLMNTENMGCPVFYGIGNHDLVDGKYGEELFESLYGPVFYSFDAGNVHYIVTPMLHGDRKPSYTKEDVYRWLKNDLAQIPKGKPIIVFSHDLLTNGDRFNYGINDKEQVDLNAHNLKAWLYGHWHINHMKKQGNVYSIGTGTVDKGGIDHSTNAFRVLHVDPKGDLVSELRYSYLDQSLHIASPTAGQVPVFASGAVPLVVNTYHSPSPTKEVSYQCIINGREAFPRQQLKRSTDWSWVASIPFTSEHVNQKVTLKVKATYANGQSAEQESSFTYLPGKNGIKLTDNQENLLGNPAHDGISPSSLKAPLKMAWVNNIGANIFMTSPIVHKGNVYTATVDENLRGEAFVCALNGSNGSILWKYPTRNSVKNTIAIDGDLVFAQDTVGFLYAINAKTGKLAWEKQLPVKGLPALIEGLVAADGVIYAGTGKGLCAFNAKNGDLLWQNKGWEQREGTTSTLTLAEGILIGSAQWGGLYANDAKTGSQLWGDSNDGLRHRASSATIRDGILYIISDKSFFMLEAKTGKVLKRKEMPFSLDATSTPLATGKHIIFGSAQSGLVALDGETLEVSWQFHTNDALIYTAPYTRKPSSTIETSPVLSGDTVYVTASDGCIYALSEKTGEMLWKHETGAPILVSPAISGNTLFMADFGGNVYAFTSANN